MITFMVIWVGIFLLITGFGKLMQWIKDDVDAQNEADARWRELHEAAQMIVDEGSEHARHRLERALEAMQ